MIWLYIFSMKLRTYENKIIKELGKSCEQICTSYWYSNLLLPYKIKTRALVRSALRRKMLSAAHARAQFFKSLALSLVPSKEWAPLSFALISKKFLVVFKSIKSCIFSNSGCYFKNLHSKQKKDEKWRNIGKGCDKIV